MHSTYSYAYGQLIGAFNLVHRMNVFAYPADMSFGYDSAEYSINRAAQKLQHYSRLDLSRNLFKTN